MRKVARIVLHSTSGWGWLWQSIEPGLLEEGEKYTVSIVMRSTRPVVNPTIRIANSSGGNKVFEFNGFTLGTNFKTITHTFTANNNVDASGLRLQISFLTGLEEPRTFYLKTAQLEKGNKDSPWAPSQKDITSEIDTLRTETFTEFAVLDGKIESKVSYKNLDGEEVKINFEQKEFANTLFAHANSIEMDEFSKSLHKNGKAELTENVKEELITITSQFYKHRVAEAIKSSIK